MIAKIKNEFFFNMMIINVDWKDFKTYIKIIHIKITQIEINFKKESDKDVTFFLKHFC